MIQITTLLSLNIIVNMLKFITSINKYLLNT